MSDKPQTIAIPPSLRAKLLACVQERDAAVERLEEMLDLIRGVLADFGTPVTPEEYDLFNLQVGFVRRAAEPPTADRGLGTADESPQSTRGPQSGEPSGPRSHNGVVIPDPEPEEEEA